MNKDKKTTTEPVEYWKCPQCGCEKTWFSRSDPMGNFCTNCGGPADEPAEGWLTLTDLQATMAWASNSAGSIDWRLGLGTINAKLTKKANGATSLAEFERRVKAIQPMEITILEKELATKDKRIAELEDFVLELGKTLGANDGFGTEYFKTRCQQLMSPPTIPKKFA